MEEIAVRIIAILMIILAVVVFGANFYYLYQIKKFDKKNEEAEHGL